MPKPPYLDEVPREITIEDGILLCPNCGGNYLHHDMVRSWFRDGEDTLAGFFTLARVGNVTTSRDAHNGNPSSRRDGVSISFWCEMCDRVFALELAQHKGCTYIGWFSIDVPDANNRLPAIEGMVK